MSMFRNSEQQRRFKVVDNTDNGQDHNGCNGHQLVLSIENLGMMDAVVNDILYVGNVVQIYGSRHAASRRSDIFRKRTKGTSKQTCSGERSNGSHGHTQEVAAQPSRSWWR